MECIIYGYFPVIVHRVYTPADIRLSRNCVIALGTNSIAYIGAGLATPEQA